ncbi:hypothetical protein F0562_010464 [Nyssa sinensis]|uniref:RNase H type-1 domain-containing protein n=1 Tax=Nyssa sinensis TaxID=561372 RepID=A0A5J4ZZ25_9ASTE|nr:hypothetical protein F0562_010464 [Nyssa sinensis]
MLSTTFNSSCWPITLSSKLANIIPGPRLQPTPFQAIIHTGNGKMVPYVAWTTTFEDSWRLNFAGSTMGESNIAGTGCILHDQNAIFKAAYAAPLKDSSNGVETELSALKFGLCVAIHQGVDYLEIEGDSAMAMRLLLGNISPFSLRIKEHLDQCMFLIGKLQTVMLHTVEDYANRAANKLAAMATDLSEPMHWIEEPPSAIIQILIEDGSCLTGSTFIGSETINLHEELSQFGYSSLAQLNAEKPIAVWVKEHGPDKGFEDAKPVIEALKSKGVSKIGAASFCWGAKVIVELSKYAYIEAAVLLHPLFVTFEDIQGVKVPMSILGAEIDKFSPPELLKQFKGVLNAKPQVDGFVKIFPGVAYGWTVRHKDEDEVAVKCAGEAHQDMLDEEENLFEGINRYCASSNLSALTKNDKAECLAKELADQFKIRPCTNTTCSNTVPGTEPQFSNYPSLLAKCHFNVTSTREGTILPTCVPKLVSSLVLSNFTHLNTPIISMTLIGLTIFFTGIAYQPH